MAQVSKYPISNVVAERIFDLFVGSVVMVKGKEEAEAYLSDVLSPTEKIMIAKRIAIAYLLSKGYQYRDISKILRVSLTTIASVNLSLRYGKGGYTTILSKIEKNENLEQFFHTVLEGALSFPAMASKGGGIWRYLHEEVKQSRKKKAF
ncbi:MAG: hypothetical protein HYV40_03700 [Candidatus Levybacteria bacterium]|nr:hypothetical protein [Candidatus Levybacteria bacterium]